MHIVTSRLSFNRETGMATSDEAVQFRFPEGEGRAIGLSYDSQRGELHLLRDVEVVFRTAGEAQPAEPSSRGFPRRSPAGDWSIGATNG